MNLFIASMINFSSYVFDDYSTLIWNITKYDKIVKKGSKNVVRLIWKLIENCFNNEITPNQWITGIQHPLYKSGEKRDPLNYRGIMLLNVTSKLYESILEKRLDSWVEKEKIIRKPTGKFEPVPFQKLLDKKWLWSGKLTVQTCKVALD